jgi:ribonuclease-3
MVRQTQTMQRSRSVTELEQNLGISFNNRALIEQAMFHRSFLNEAAEDVESNERMEFLGDAVLGLVVSERLFRDYPGMTEGQLSQVRAILVRWDALARAAERIELGEYLVLGKGEELSGGRRRPSNLAGAFEAVIGAAYMDQGFEFAQSLVLQLLKPDFDEIAAQGFSADSKSELQHVAQTRWHQIPSYTLVSSEGPDHAKLFTVEVSVGDQTLGQGQGRNKKQAELNAARQALETLAATG